MIIAARLTLYIRKRFQTFSMGFICYVLAKTAPQRIIVRVKLSVYLSVTV